MSSAGVGPDTEEDGLCGRQCSRQGSLRLGLSCLSSPRKQWLGFKVLHRLVPGSSFTRYNLGPGIESRGFCEGGVGN